MHEESGQQQLSRSRTKEDWRRPMREFDRETTWSPYSTHNRTHPRANFLARPNHTGCAKKIWLLHRAIFTILPLHTTTTHCYSVPCTPTAHAHTNLVIICDFAQLLLRRRRQQQQQQQHQKPKSKYLGNTLGYADPDFACAPEGINHMRHCAPELTILAFVRLYCCNCKGFFQHFVFYCYCYLLLN